MSQFEQRPEKARSSLFKSRVPDRAISQPVHVESPTPAYQPLGNQAAQRFAQSCPLGLPSPSVCPFGGTCHTCPAPVQAKLKLNEPGDRYEQEADRVAEQVMRMPDPRVQRQAEPLAGQITPLIQRQVEPEEEEEPVQARLEEGALLQRQEEEPEEEEEEPVQAKLAEGGVLQRQDEEWEEEGEEPAQAKPADGQARAANACLQPQVSSLRGRGQPLPASERAFFEPRFGHSLDGVQVHTGTPAAETARAVSAKAFTVGQDIVFGAGQFAPDSQAGKQVLAHELTHVIQQTPRLSRKSVAIQRQPAPGGGVPTAAAPAECVCPASIRRDFTLACDCFNRIRVAANNITLDCAGHKLTGSGRGHGILLRNLMGVTVRNCNITGFSNGVALRSSTGNTLTNNKSFANARDGFDFNDSNENSLIENSATNNPSSNGIELDNCSRNNLRKNIVKENQDGIDLNQSNENTLEENTANENLRDGFRINRNSDSNTVRINTANDNGRDGFRIDGNSDRNTFTGNTANNNSSDGFDLISGIGNTCKNNTFTHPGCPEP